MVEEAVMLKLWFAPRTRAVRVRWLLEELGVPHELARVDFNRPSHTFAQNTPLGKLPVIEDDGVTIGESGAIVEYILERYGNGRLAPPIGAAPRGEFLQWVHFAESTAFPPIGVIVWHTLYEQNADRFPEVMASARARALEALGFVDKRLEGRDYLLGKEFSGADVMMGFTLFAARALGVLDDGYPNVTRYLAQLEQRPAFQKAAELT
jgi:glutathione S-transferase